jgi:dephospho-CoA kinase
MLGGSSFAGMTNIAITGGIASGKSLLGKLLSELGADVLDVDEIIRSMHEPGGRGAEMVASVFGKNYLADNGGTNRVKLGNFVFNNPAALKRLNDLMHPIARQAALEWRDAPSHAPFKAALVPLLFESGWRADWEAAAAIESPLKARVKRLAARGLSREEAMARVNAQLPAAQRRARADIVILNDSGIPELRRAAEHIFKYMEKTIK